MVGIVGTIGLLAAVINRLRTEFGIAVAGPSYLAAFVVYVVGWLLLFARLPKRTTDPGALLPGVALVAGTTTIMQLVSQLYLPDRIARASELYGAIGTSIVTLGWFFFIARAITLAMTLNAVLDERVGSVSRLVFALPVLRVLPRRSARLRRYFGLDDEDAVAR
jgi:uncharacterized BrkB/YihY/UPF0761 family membrane protein